MKTLVESFAYAVLAGGLLFLLSLPMVVPARAGPCIKCLPSGQCVTFDDDRHCRMFACASPATRGIA